MATTSIRSATPEDARVIAEFVRPEDRDELWAAAYMKPEEAMMVGMKLGDARVGCIDGVPICMWGIKRESFIGKVGIPWMVGTYALDRYATRFLRRNHLFIQRALSEYDRLVNYVDSRNTRAIGWLMWLGFKIHDAEPYGALKLPFHKFSMEAHHV